MSTQIINYVFTATEVANPDGTLPIKFKNTTVEAPGPGLIREKYTSAIALGENGTGSVNISKLESVDASRFHVQAVFRIDTEFIGSQHIVESDRLPFQLRLVGSPGDIQLSASVRSKTVGWKTTEMYSNSKLALSTWHIADMVYDVDTLGLFLDGEVLSLHGFGTEGTIEIDDDRSDVTIGGQQSSYHFSGKLAALRLSIGIPLELKALLDASRTSPQWHITSKLESLRPTLDLGQPLGTVSFDVATSVWYQNYGHGSLYFHSAASSAFEMHGAIHARYMAFADTKKTSLGHLVTDEVSSNEIGRKSLFSKGGIYWSAKTRAFEVTGQIYIDYEKTGEALKWGFPLETPQALPGGFSQKMQKATWYHKTGSACAHAVYGAIDKEFLATGGVEVWGYPVSDSIPVRNDKLGGRSRDSRVCEFEGCTFYWSRTTGAHELHGEIRSEYNSLGGPSGDMGLPTTHEIESLDEARMNIFEGGSIRCFRNVCTPQVTQPCKTFRSQPHTDVNKNHPFGPNDLCITTTLDRARAQCYIDHKRCDLCKEGNSELKYDDATSAWYVNYNDGSIHYHSSASSAFEMHGAINARYRSFSDTEKASLGHLISDEVFSSNEKGRKSLFSKGGIYWSAFSGAFEVTGQIYIDYEKTGEALKWGFPLETPQALPGGFSQKMQKATWYHKTGSACAHTVYGAIEKEFLATGGVEVWGYPVSDSIPVRNIILGGSSRDASVCEFEGCTFYSSSLSGTHEVHGEIRSRYNILGGPSGTLGLPCTNEVPTPDGTGYMNRFEGGTIRWYANAGTAPCKPLDPASISQQN